MGNHKCSHVRQPPCSAALSDRRAFAQWYVAIMARHTKWMLRDDSIRRRPYRVECTGSLLTSEVKRRRARLVLGWGTAREDLRVLSAIYIPMHRDQLLLTRAPYTQGAVIFFRKLFHYNIAEYDCVLALTSLASRPASSPNLHFLVLPPNPFQSLSATPQNLQSQNTKLIKNYEN